MHAGCVQHLEINLVGIERAEKRPEGKDDYPLQPADSARRQLVEFRSVTLDRHGGEVYIMARSWSLSATECEVSVHLGTQHSRPEVRSKHFCSEARAKRSEWLGREVEC